MSEPSLGTWLRRERERRGISLRSICDETKVALPLLQGLEDDDVSRWPGGIFRRAFVRSYASAVGLDSEEILRRFELEHGESQAVEQVVEAGSPKNPAPSVAQPAAGGLARPSARTILSKRTRVAGTAADLAVALVIGLCSAAAGSRLLWPVALIALYYAVGVLLTGTSPMVALLREETGAPRAPATPAAPEPRVISAEPQAPARRPLRVVRPARSARRAQ